MIIQEPPILVAVHIEVAAEILLIAAIADTSVDSDASCGSAWRKNKVKALLAYDAVCAPVIAGSHHQIAFCIDDVVLAGSKVDEVVGFYKVSDSFL